MLRLLLVQPPHRDTFGYSMPPLGALRLGAVARDAGHEVDFLDLALLVRRGELTAGEDLAARAAERILELEPELVGVGAMVPSLPAALELAAELRARAPDLPLLLGGQGPEQVEEQVLARHPGYDAIAVGEAERSFGELLEEIDLALRAQGFTNSTPSREVGDSVSTTKHRLSAAESGSETAPEGPKSTEASVRTLSARRFAIRAALREAPTPGFVVATSSGAPRHNPPRGTEPELDSLLPPAWDLAESPAEYGLAAGGGETLFPLDLGRGCPFTCRFCTTSVFWGHSARWLSPERAVDEMERLAAQPGLDVIYVTHDLFTAHRAHALALCAEIERRAERAGRRFTWECRTRLDLVDAELLAALGRAGCRRILFGVESVSPARLEGMRKGGASAQLDHAEVLRRVELAAEHGVASILGLMIGLPGETRDDVEANLQLAAEAALVPGLSLSLHWYTPTPGNAHMAEGETPLRFEPSLGADLVRGHDLPAGAPPSAQRRMVAEDAEVFRAFRVHVPEHTSAQELHRLTRHAHLVLEVLPRSLRLAAQQAGERLVDLLSRLLERAVEVTPADTFEAWSEPGVLTRAAVVQAVARELGDVSSNASSAAAPHTPVADLVRYELALFEADAPQLLELAHDPRDPTSPRLTRLLVHRRGERVRVHRLSALLANAFEQGLDAPAPDDDDALREARARLRALLAPTDAPPAAAEATPAHDARDRDTDAPRDSTSPVAPRAAHHDPEP